MPPIRVAIVITRLDLGGAQEVALATAQGLNSELFDVRLLAGPGGAMDARAREALGARFVPVPGLVHPIAPLQDLWALLWLWAYLLRHRIQVLHSHSSKAGLLGRLAAFLARTPKVLHTVHGWSFNDFQSRTVFGFYVNLERFLARLSERLVVVAASLRDKGLLLGVGRPDQYVLVRAGVDLDAWASTPRSRKGLRRLLPELRPRVVGTLANMKAQKAPLDFVRVAALVLRGRPGLDFVYVGDGPLRPAAEALARDLGVAGRVHFLGWQEDPRALVAGLDVFLLTSLYEGLPCVFPQALSLGLPVVATRVDGAAEAVKEGLNGYLCQPCDCEALADRVATLVDDAALRRSLGQAAKRGVGPEFSVRSLLERSAALYAA